MEKTFKSINNNTELYVGEGMTSAGLQLIIRDVGKEVGRAGIYLSGDDVPALALAILEAAGYTEDDRKESNPVLASEFARAIAHLAEGIEEQESATAAAREQAELEQEALELCNEFIEDFGYDRVDSWDGSVPSKKSAWLAVARRARELGGRAEK